MHPAWHQTPALVFVLTGASHDSRVIRELPEVFWPRVKSGGERCFRPLGPLFGWKVQGFQRLDSPDGWKPLCTGTGASSACVGWCSDVCVFRGGGGDLGSSTPGIGWVKKQKKKRVWNRKAAVNSFRKTTRSHGSPGWLDPLHTPSLNLLQKKNPPTKTPGGWISEHARSPAPYLAVRWDWFRSSVLLEAWRAASEEGVQYGTAAPRWQFN